MASIAPVPNGPPGVAKPSVAAPSRSSGLIDCLGPIGFGAFKIGRNVATKYEQAYALPSDAEASGLLNGVLDLGISYIDTAPAYGHSEELIGRCLSGRRGEFVLSTKVGESFDGERSTYDFSETAVRRSVERSLRRLRTDVLDLVFIHASREDLRVITDTDVVPTLVELRNSGLVRWIGLSGYSAAAFSRTLDWADAIMVAYNPLDGSLAPMMTEARSRGKAVVVKKGLASGHSAACQGIPFVLGNPDVDSMVIGSLSLDHMRENWRIAMSARGATNGMGARGDRDAG